MIKRWQVVTSSLLIGIALGWIVTTLVSARIAAHRPRGGVARDYEELRSLEVMTLYLDMLPRNGRNFRYYAALCPAYANISFEILEEGFHEWVSVQGWGVSEIGEASEHETSSFLFEKPDGEMMWVRSEDGLIYSESTLRGSRLERSTDVLYDRGSGIAYYRYTCD